jgi:hypothetical protein
MFMVLIFLLFNIKIRYKNGKYKTNRYYILNIKNIKIIVILENILKMLYFLIIIINLQLKNNNFKKQ